jgi:TnpA family transposase
MERRRATSTHGSRVGSRRAQRRGTGVSSGLAGRNRSCSPLSGMRVLTVHINTEIIFALFDLEGFRFTPRLRDVGRQRLYTSGALDMQCYPRLQPYVRWRIRRPRILDWWEEMLRVAGSIRLGWVTASLFVQKLHAYPRKSALARALQEYGRLIKTLHILRWYCQPDDRRRITRQLNKGEALHDLRAFLLVANKGP